MENHFKFHFLFCNSKSKTRGQITDEFAAVIVELWNGKYKSIAPRDFRYVFGQYQKMFSGYEQQDSHEFLTILMDNLHLELELTLDEVFRSSLYSQVQKIQTISYFSQFLKTN